MKQQIKTRNYRPGDLESLVALMNEADAHDKLERATTMEEMRQEVSFPGFSPETDCFLAWAGDRPVGYVNMYARRGNAQIDAEGAIYCWGEVHPRWRRQGLGRRLMETAYGRAIAIVPTMEIRRVKFQSTGRDVEAGKLALYEAFGMQRVRYWVELARSMNGNLPPVEVPNGIRLRTYDPERDAETVWRVDNAAFHDHWGHNEGALEDFLHWSTLPHMRSDLWYLAEEEASGEIVGLGLNVVDPVWIAQTGRQEGYVDTLAVVREHRKRGLGRALLARCLHGLHDAGMDAAHLHADSDNLTGAMRLYERMGFSVRKTSVSYQKMLRDA